jgi:hypothetical protein
LQLKIEYFFFEDLSITAAIKNGYLSMPGRIEKVIERKKVHVDIDYFLSSKILYI